MCVKKGFKFNYCDTVYDLNFPQNRVCTYVPTIPSPTTTTEPAVSTTIALTTSATITAQSTSEEHPTTAAGPDTTVGTGNPTASLGELATLACDTVFGGVGRERWRI